jgi:Tfp pilus assembly protein PilF
MSARRPDETGPDRRAPGGALLLIVLLSCLGPAGCATSEESAKAARAYFNQGIASLDQDQQSAFVSFQKAVQADPKLKEAHYYLGHLYVLKEKYGEAEEQLRKVLALDPDYSEAHTYLGQVLEAQGKWSEGVASYRRALANPTYGTPDVAWYRLGRALLRQGDFQGGLRALEDADTVRPLNVPPAMLQLELGRAYHQLGYTSKAREALTKASTLDKTGPEGTEARRLLSLNQQKP